jgi:hypothetical protein
MSTLSRRLLGRLLPAVQVAGEQTGEAHRLPVLGPVERLERRQVDGHRVGSLVGWLAPVLQFTHPCTADSIVHQSHTLSDVRPARDVAPFPPGSPSRLRRSRAILELIRVDRRGSADVEPGDLAP